MYLKCKVSVEKENIKITKNFLKRYWKKENIFKSKKKLKKIPIKSQLFQLIDSLLFLEKVSFWQWWLSESITYPILFYPITRPKATGKIKKDSRRENVTIFVTIPFSSYIFKIICMFLYGVH